MPLITREDASKDSPSGSAGDKLYVTGGVPPDAAGSVAAVSTPTAKVGANSGAERLNAPDTEEVVAVRLSDQSPVPSSLVARTCTS